MNDIVFLVLIAWLVHAVIAGVPLALIVPLARNRVHWQWWELSALFLPYGIFAALMLSHVEPKNPLNMFDATYISVAVVMAATARLVVGARIKERLYAPLLVCLLCLVAAIVYFMAPVVRDSM